MSEENKALTRRSWEIVATGSLDTLDDALQECTLRTSLCTNPTKMFVA